MMRKNFFLFTIIAALFMTGCSQTVVSEDEEKPEYIIPDVELNVVVTEYSQNSKTFWSTFESDFEKDNPDIDLNIEVEDWSDIGNVIRAGLSVNQVPDILNYDGFTDYAQANLLLEADSYISSSLKDNILQDYYGINEFYGDLMAVPMLVSCRGLFCNMDLLNKAGIQSAPKTWKEVMAACEALKASNPDIIPWGMEASFESGPSAFSYYIWNNGGGYLNENEEWNLNSFENIQAIEFVKSLVTGGYCGNTIKATSPYEVYESFGKGQIAMMIGPMSVFDYVDGFKVSISSIPVGNTDMSKSLGLCDGFMVFKKDKDEAQRNQAISRFFDYFYSDERYCQFVCTEGFLPSTTSSREYFLENIDEVLANSGKEDYKELYKQFLSMEIKSMFYPSDHIDWDKVRYGLCDAMEKIYAGDDVTKTLNKLQLDVMYVTLE